jgi:hypothetical protein
LFSIPHSLAVVCGLALAFQNSYSSYGTVTRSLTTNIEFEIFDDSLYFDVVIGNNWMAAWRIVGREDSHIAGLRPISGGEQDSVWIAVSRYRLADLIHF